MNLQQLNEYEVKDHLGNIPVSWDSYYDYLEEEVKVKFKKTPKELKGVKLSRPSKMPKNVPTWDLEAGATCPASKCPKTGKTKPSCRNCYAQGYRYNSPEAIALRKHNRKDWKRSDWVDDMVGLLQDLKRFRWFSSGDVYTPKLADKIYEVMKKTPETDHWFPTMSHTIPKLGKKIDQMDKLPNVKVRRSAGRIDGTYADIDGSTIITPDIAAKWVKNGAPAGVTICPATLSKDGEVPQTSNKKEGRKKIKSVAKCGTCRDCWYVDDVIAYVLH